MSDVRDNLSKNLKKLRAQRNLTQEQLAEKISVDALTIRNYETKRRWPDPDKIEAIARALGIHESLLFLDQSDVEQRLKDAPSPEIKEAFNDPDVRIIINEVLKIRRQSAAIPEDIRQWAALHEIETKNWLMVRKAIGMPNTKEVESLARNLESIPKDIVAHAPYIDENQWNMIRNVAKVPRASKSKKTAGQD